MESQMAVATYEEDYLVRTHSKVTNSPDIALTELIANSWDCGALNVKINIPTEPGERLTIEDDGSEMSYQQFLDRWMKLAYNRQKHQGSDVKFPENVNVTNRRAYGRNGIGRHGLLCFSNIYEVETWRDGKGNIFDISVSSDEQPFKILQQKSFERTEHGTKFSVCINRNFPKVKIC